MRRIVLTVSVLLALNGIGTNLVGAENATNELVPLELKLPQPAFVGTPQNVPLDSDVEPLSTKPRPPMMVPKGLANLAPASKISCSDSNVAASTLAKITDGNKDATDENLALLRKRTQYVQFDLGAANQIYAIVIWHAHDTAKIYRDVIVQVSDDPEFAKDVRTLFNNDKDNSSNLGAGTNREYFETREGKLVDAKGAVARCVRVYSRGSTESVLNESTEVEIYGRPAK
jgi:hypothetical protein